ncbi:IQ domain-containing protein G, partial [Ophiophagus hannah]
MQDILASQQELSMKYRNLMDKRAESLAKIPAELGKNRNEMIAYLKDQLQEMKAKTDMENRYVKKDTDLQVAQAQKKCFATENDLQNEIECRACEQAIIEDRKEKENARKKLQAWWRGMMVRRFLGPYKNLKKMLEEEPVTKDKGKKGKPGLKKKK